MECTEQNKGHIEYKNWGDCYWSSKENSLAEYSRAAGMVAQGVYFIPPFLHGVTLKDGLWSELNFKLDTWFDQAESEEIPVEKLEEIASEIDRFSDRVYGEKYGSRVVVVGHVMSNDRTPIVLTTSYEEIRECLVQLVDFLLDAYRQGENVTIIL